MFWDSAAEKPGWKFFTCFGIAVKLQLAAYPTRHNPRLALLHAGSEPDSVALARSRRRAAPRFCYPTKVVLILHDARRENPKERKVGLTELINTSSDKPAFLNTSELVVVIADRDHVRRPPAGKKPRTAARGSAVIVPVIGTVGYVAGGPVLAVLMAAIVFVPLFVVLLAMLDRRESLSPFKRLILVICTIIGRSPHDYLPRA